MAELYNHKQNQTISKTFSPNPKLLLLRRILLVNEAGYKMRTADLRTCGPAKV